MATDQTPGPDEPARLPFDAQFVQIIEAFSNTVLNEIPELHGIAIVPLWNNQPEDMPAGLLQLRNPRQQYFPSLTLLLKRLAAFNVEVQKDLFGQVSGFEQYLVDLDRRVKARVDELNQLNKHPEHHDQPQ